MKYRVLGSSDLEIAPFVLGETVFGWTADEATSHRTEADAGKSPRV